MSNHSLKGSVILPDDSRIGTPRFERSTRDYEDGDEYGPNFLDHFSLGTPSSTVKFRGNRVHVYEGFNEQFVLEDRKSSQSDRHNITVKRIPIGGFGLLMLRMAYTLVALLMFAGSFVVTWQILFFLFVKVAVTGRLAVEGVDENGVADTSNITFRLISTILTCPIFLYGFSNLMGMATTFVTEAWNGGDLIRSVLGVPTLAREVAYFFFFILVPSVTFIVCLFIRNNRPWEITVFAWATSVVTVFFFFCMGVVWGEFKYAFRLVTIHYGEVGFFAKLKRCILIYLREKYSGTVQDEYLVSGDEPAPDGGYMFSEKHEPTDKSRSLYTRITQMDCMKCMFDTLDKPKRIYSVDEILDELPYITKNTWGLERTFCMGNKDRYIVSASGPSALKRSQVIASVICNINGTLLIITSVVGYLYWMSTGLISYIVLGVLLFLCCMVPLITSNIEAMKTFSSAKKCESGAVDEEGGGSSEELGSTKKTNEVSAEHEEINFFRLWETARVTEPKEWACWTALAVESLVLFVWPLASLFSSGLYGLGLVFLVLAILNYCRILIDESSVLCELGPLSDVNIETGKEKGHSAEATTRRKSRLANIVGRVSRAEHVTRWAYFYVGFIFIVLIMISLAATDDNGLGERPPVVMLDDYEYVSEDSLQYPSCTLNKGFGIEVAGQEVDTNLADYAFMTVMAYEEPSATSVILPKMFGEGIVVDESEFVTEFREKAGNAKIPLYFKFFTFPNSPDAGLIAIRGSQTMWDWMVNFQTWSSSCLAQVMKWLLPYGWIWTSVMDDLAYVASFLQTEELDDASYSRITIDFANQMKQNYSNLQATGGSLGGGMAMITGTKAKIPAVAISGPSPVLPRHILNITMDDINKYAFNFIPDRDPIARFGGRVRNNQQGECYAPHWELIGCHSMWRSVCELYYRCGTNGRPVLCRCHYQYGYPLPTPIGNATRTFEEACLEEELAFLNATGGSINSKWFYKFNTTGDDDEL